MAKGYEAHRERLEAIARLGKPLARRAGRRCEWCEAEAGGEHGDLRPYDHVPDAEPSLDTLALLCARCRGLIEGERADPRALRFLEGAIWHEVAAVREPAVALLRTLDADWAREALETAGL
ncbi:MAG: hypothetical protein D6776_11050 [Planctomycetota bacterium]|nr:MAG: hypothetical protein D6776_11050 [Planctomycetota bacterium]